MLVDRPSTKRKITIYIENSMSCNILFINTFLNILNCYPTNQVRILFSLVRYLIRIKNKKYN